MLEDLSKITAIYPSAAGRASNEVIGLALWRTAEAPSKIFPALYVGHQFMVRACKVATTDLQ